MPLLLMRHLRLVGLTLLLFCLTGCASSILAQRGLYLQAYHEGDLCQAETHLDSLMQKTETKVSYQRSKEASWLLLDRATLRFARGKLNAAIEDYAQAIESLAYYDQSLPTEQCAQLLLQDDTAAYQASDFEQVLARVYFALALLHQNDESNAYALLRQAEEYQQEKRSFYAKVPFTCDYRLPDNGLSKYLFALLLEKRGDLSNARLLYQQASQLIPCAQEISCRPTRTAQQATILVMCHNGNVPHKVSATSPASVASACALEFLLATQNIDPAWSTLSGIPVPALCDWSGSYPVPTYAQVDGIQQPLLAFYSVAQAAREELQQKMPVIVARGVARLLMRRYAVGYLDRQDPCLGALADLTMCIVNDTTRADTRSWTTLPAFIDVARFDVEPGHHQLKLQIDDDPYLDIKTLNLTLAPHDLCIIHIFNIHPGVRQVLVPSRYLIKQGKCP